MMSATAPASWMLPSLYSSASTDEVLETMTQHARQSSFTNFVQLPNIQGGISESQQSGRRAKQRNRTHTHLPLQHPWGAQTDRSNTHSHSLPVLRDPQPVAAVPHTSRAHAARSKPSAATAIVPSALDSPAMFTPAPRSAWALGSASLAALASTGGGLEAAASVGGDRGGGAIGLSTTHGAQRRKFSSDAARAEAWKAAARVADQQSKGHGTAAAAPSKSRSKPQLQHEEKRPHYDPLYRDYDRDQSPESDEEDLHNPETHSREVMHILRPASRPSEAQTGEAGVSSGSLAVPGGLGGSSGKLGTPRSRRGSVSLKALLSATDPGLGSAAAAVAHATSTARRRDSLIEGLLASGAGMSGLAAAAAVHGHSRGPSGTGSGGNSGRTTPRSFSNRRGSRDMRAAGAGEQKAGSKGSSGTVTPSGSGIVGSASSASLGRHHLAPVDDDPSSESRSIETSAYYSIIQSATRRLAEQLENLDPSEEMLLRKEWTERGMTEEEIANRLRRRNIVPQPSSQQQSVTLLAAPTATGARSTASLPAFSISVSPSTDTLGGDSSNNSPSSPTRFLLGGSSSAASLQQQPSNYDRYRASFSTVRALIDSMARSSSGTAADGPGGGSSHNGGGHPITAPTSKEGLFQSVSRFFNDRSKLDVSESRKLDALLNENQEVEAGVESTARFLDRAIKLKEVHDIKLLNGYYSSLRQMHLKHQGGKKGSASASAKRNAIGGSGSSSAALPALAEDAVDFLALGAIIAGDFAPSADAGSNPAAELFERMDAVGLALHAPPVSSPPPITGRFLPKPLADGSATLLRASQNTASSISASEAMESLQQKLADVAPGGEAHALKMELLISMLTAKLGEQNRVIAKHPPLAARRKEFEAKASHVLQTVAQTQAALKAEELRLQDLDDLKRETAGRLHHLARFETAEKLMASVSAEQQVQAKQKEDAEDAALLRMHQDRALMDEHLAEVERASAELSTRLKRLDGELAHLQRQRESERMKTKLLEKQLKKEVSLVLNGQIPPALAKELAQEQELLLRDRRTEERLENSEPVRMDFNIGTSAAAAAAAAASPATDSSTSPTDESKEKEAAANALASPHDDDDDSDRSSEHSDAQSRIGSAAQKSVKRNRSRQNSVFNGSPALNSASRPTSVAPSHARSHSRWGAASASTRAHRRAPSSFSLGMAPGEDPEALVSIRAGVAELGKIKEQLTQALEADVAALVALGIPLETAVRDRPRARKRSMEGVKEGEEAADERSPERQSHGAPSIQAAEPDESKRAAKRKSMEAGESVLSPSASEKKLGGRAGAKGKGAQGPPGRSPITSTRRGAGASKDKASSSKSTNESKSNESKGQLAASKSERKLGAAASSKKKGAAEIAAAKEKRKSSKKGTEAAPATSAVPPAAAAPEATSPEPTPRQIAADSMRRRRSFESRYSNLLASPDVSAAPAVIPADPDDEVVLDFDANGKINGAFTRREVRAQTARFRAQIQALANEHRVMSKEIGKLTVVGPKLAAAQHQEQVNTQTYTALEAELAELMSRHRAAQIAAEAHGLVVGSDPSDLTADDIAEHAIWAEDGFTGEAHVPSLENEEWTVEWQAEEDARAKRELEAEKARTAKMKEEAAALETQKSLVSSSSSSAVAATSSAVVSPVSSPRSSTQALRQSAAEAVAAALIAKEDAEDEADEARTARDTWEDALRERFEAQAQSSGEYAPKVARFSVKIAKLQQQLDSLRITTGTEAELLREKIAMLHSKSQAVLAAKEAALQAKITEAEPAWQAEWNAGQDARQERRTAARTEAARAEAAANKAEAARLKREKRQAANAGTVAANSIRKSANLSLRRSTSMSSPRGSRNALFAPSVRSQLKQSGGSASGSSAETSPVKFSKQKSMASAPSTVSISGAALVPPAAISLFAKGAPTVVADITEDDEAAETASVAAVAPMPVADVLVPATVVSELTAASENSEVIRASSVPAASQSLLPPAALSAVLLPLHTEHTRLQSTKDSLAQRIEEVRRAIEMKKSGESAAARRKAKRASQSVMLQQAIDSAFKEAEQWKLIAQGVTVADPPMARATAVALNTVPAPATAAKQASDPSSSSPPKLAMHVSLQHAPSDTADPSLQSSPIAMQSDSTDFPSTPHTAPLSLDDIDADEPLDQNPASFNEIGAWNEHVDPAAPSASISDSSAPLALASATSRFLDDITAPIEHTSLRTHLSHKLASSGVPAVATTITPGQLRATESIVSAVAAPSAHAAATLDRLDIPEQTLRRSSLVAADAAAAARERWARRQFEIIAEQQRTMAALAAQHVNAPSYAAVATTELERQELLIDLTTAPAATKISPVKPTGLAPSSSHSSLRGQPSVAAAGQRRPSAMPPFVPPVAAAESYIVSSGSPSKARPAASSSSHSLHSSPGSSATSSSVSLMAGSGSVYGPSANLGGANQPLVAPIKVGSSNNGARAAGAHTSVAPSPVLRTLNLSAILMQSPAAGGSAGIPSLSSSALLQSSSSDSHSGSDASLQSFLEPISASARPMQATPRSKDVKASSKHKASGSNPPPPSDVNALITHMLQAQLANSESTESLTQISAMQPATVGNKRH